MRPAPPCGSTRRPPAAEPTTTTAAAVAPAEPLATGAGAPTSPPQTDVLLRRRGRLRWLVIAQADRADRAAAVARAELEALWRVQRELTDTDRELRAAGWRDA